MSVASLTQGVINVVVSFYDAEEREKLLKFPTSSELLEIEARGIGVPVAEFLTYYLFHRKRLGHLEYRNYASIGMKANIALAALDGCVEFTGQSLCTFNKSHEQLREVSEHIGEAIGLCVIGRIHKLIEADWYPIKERRGAGALPTFDFELASDGDRFIQVENKGSSVANNRLVSPAIRQHKSNIAEKKRKIETTASDSITPSVLRYGTIAAIDPRRDGSVRCWLVDPAPDPADENPRRFRLLRRMRFLLEWISLISPRSQLAAALATRISDLDNLQNPFELDGVRLLRGTGEPFSFQPTTGPHSSFMASRSRISDGPAGGIITRLNRGALLLIGIREELLEIAADQSFEQISTFRFPSTTQTKTVQCVLSRARFASLGLPRSIVGEGPRGSGYMRFNLSGQIQYSSSGVVFGVLPMPSS